MNRKKIYSSALVLLGAGAGIAGAIWCGKHYKRTRSQYQQTCFYIAALDDEICRKELDGMVVAEKTISFPPRRETLTIATRFFGRCIVTCHKKNWKRR